MPQANVLSLLITLYLIQGSSPLQQQQGAAFFIFLIVSKYYFYCAC